MFLVLRLAYVTIWYFVITIAVNMDVINPIIRVTEKPLMGPLPKIKSANAAIKVVKFASTIVETALLKP